MKSIGFNLLKSIVNNSYYISHIISYVDDNIFKYYFQTYQMAIDQTKYFQNQG